MEAHDRHVAVDYAKVAIAFAAVLFAVMFTVLVLWLVMAQQNSKLYEADNMVCVSQPFAVQCFKR